MLSLLKEKNSLLISSYTVDQYLGQFWDITILNSFQVKRNFSGFGIDDFTC